MIVHCSSLAVLQLRTEGLVTNYGEGEATKREGEAREVLPLRKGGGGAEKDLAMLKGGHKRLKPYCRGGVKCFHSLKVLPCLEGGGGGAKSFGPAIFPFCSSPPPRN